MDSWNRFIDMNYWFCPRMSECWCSNHKPSPILPCLRVQPSKYMAGLSLLKLQKNRLEHHSFKSCFLNKFCFFPTCQVRVVRFYQSALPPPHLPPPRPPPPPRLAVLFLLVLLLLASSFSFSSTMSASTSTCTSALPTLRQALCQLSSPTLCAKLFDNFPAQCAPLDLNRGPAQLSVHRWTSTAR